MSSLVHVCRTSSGAPGPPDQCVSPADQVVVIEGPGSYLCDGERVDSESLIDLIFEADGAVVW